eukprot:232081-Chlamydomonas_euryale.AAC.1
MDGWMDGQMDGWTGGRTVGWMDGSRRVEMLLPGGGAASRFARPVLKGGLGRQVRGCPLLLAMPLCARQEGGLHMLRITLGMRRGMGGWEKATWDEGLRKGGRSMTSRETVDLASLVWPSYRASLLQHSQHWCTRRKSAHRPWPGTPPPHANPA